MRRVSANATDHDVIVLDDVMRAGKDGRTWRIVSALWDDTWTCGLGGPDALIKALQRNPLANAREVDPDQYAQPPGLTRD